MSVCLFDFIYNVPEFFGCFLYGLKCYCFVVICLRALFVFSSYAVLLVIIYNFPDCLGSCLCVCLHSLFFCVRCVFAIVVDVSLF